MVIWCAMLRAFFIAPQFNKQIYKYATFSTRKNLRFLVSTFALRMFAAFSFECYCFLTLYYHIFNELAYSYPVKLE